MYNLRLYKYHMMDIHSSRNIDIDSVFCHCFDSDIYHLLDPNKVKMDMLLNIDFDMLLYKTLGNIEILWQCPLECLVNS
jgi:hypothetical protein